MEIPVYSCVLKASPNTTNKYPLVSESENSTAGATAGAELVLGADIVFDPALLPSLAATLRTLLARAPPRPALDPPRPALAVVACCVRNNETFAAFENILSEMELTVSREVLSDASPPVYLLQIRL